MHGGLTPPLAVGAHEVLEEDDLAGVALGADLVTEHGGGDPGELGEAREQVVLVRVELAPRSGPPVGRRSFAAQRSPCGIATDSELPQIALIETPGRCRATMFTHSSTLTNGTVLARRDCDG